ncbi:MAG: DNA repair exonuclease [Candidatus Omnitrophica bacterium]|nr:DNA repair exonuclease [Candidatus Omnitrophota bacterium]HPP02683.1 DNA repair exonuclease [bacterium]
MKFLHTADWQMGMKASHTGDAGEKVRTARMESLNTLAAIAREHRVDFILVAGDVFEDNGVDRMLIQKVADRMNQFPAPVYVIPGNHDPLVPGSVWEHPAWKSASNVHVLRDPQAVEVPGGVLYPCPCREKSCFQDPTKWIKDRDLSRITVGMAHGTVEGVQSEPDYPIPRDAATRAGLDYLALGHWHSFALFSSPDGAPRMAYSGTHETTKFGERDSGNALLVEIAEPGAVPTLTPVRSGRLTWMVVEKDLRQKGELAELRARIEAMEQPESTLLDIRLAGLLHGEEQEELNRIQEIISSRFLYGSLDQTCLRPSPEDPRWIDILPAGYLQEAGRRIQAWSDPTAGGSRPEGVTPAMASRALLELYALAKEVGR